MRGSNHFLGERSLCVGAKINVVHTAKKQIIKCTSFIFAEALGFRLCRPHTFGRSVRKKGLGCTVAKWYRITFEGFALLRFKDATASTPTNVSRKQYSLHCDCNRNNANPMLADALLSSGRQGRLDDGQGGAVKKQTYLRVLVALMAGATCKCVCFLCVGCQ